MSLKRAKSTAMCLQFLSAVLNKKFLKVGFVLAIFLGGCIQVGLAASQVDSSAKPRWTTTGTHPSYQPPRYILGVGLAKADKDTAMGRQVADQNAFTEITRQISAEVSSKFSMEIMEIKGDKAETLLERTSSGAKISSSVMLSGLIIVERYYDPQEEIYYSLGVLDRITASEPYLRELEGYRQDYARYSKSAMEYRQQGKVFQSLLSLRDAYHAAYRHQEKLPFYQLLAGRAGDIDLETKLSPAAILEKLTGVLAHLEFRVAKGDRQSFVYDKPLPAPLVARLILNDGTPISAEGFPVTFSFHTGQGTLISQEIRTDNMGAATAVVSQVERSNDREYTVAADIEFHELLGAINDGGIWNSRIPVEPQRVLFTLVPKKARGISKILILVPDQNDGGAALMSNVLATNFLKAGFRPVTKSEIGGTQAVQIEQNLRSHSMENLKKLIPKNVEIVVLAEISSISSDQAMGMIACRIDGTVKAYSARDGKLIASEPLQDVRGFGATWEQAMNDAFKNAGQEIADPLVGDFLSRGDVQ